MNGSRLSKKITTSGTTINISRKRGHIMHILVFVTMFIIMSIMAAFDNDWSGIIFISKVIGFIAFLIVFALIFCQK